MENRAVHGFQFEGWREFYDRNSAGEDSKQWADEDAIRAHARVHGLVNELLHANADSLSPALLQLERARVHNTWYPLDMSTVIKDSIEIVQPLQRRCDHRQLFIRGFKRFGPFLSVVVEDAKIDR